MVAIFVAQTAAGLTDIMAMRGIENNLRNLVIACIDCCFAFFSSLCNLTACKVPGPPI